MVITLFIALAYIIIKIKMIHLTSSLFYAHDYFNEANAAS